MLEDREPPNDLDTERFKRIFIRYIVPPSGFRSGSCRRHQGIQLGAARPGGTEDPVYYDRTPC